ncbi:hypothetical protein Vafri_7220, partial [Volvox africanus]
MRLDVDSEDYLRRFRDWDIVSLTSSKEPKGLVLKLRPPRSCRAFQVPPALDADPDVGYGLSSRAPPGADLVPPSRQGPAHDSMHANSDRQGSSSSAALRGVGIMAGSCPNLGRASRCSHVLALTEPNPDTSDYEDGMVVDGELDGNLKAAVTRALALSTWVNCASVPKIGRPGRRFDASPVDETLSQPMLPVQRHRSNSHALKLILVSPPQRGLQDPPQRPRSQPQLQNVQLQTLQSEEVGVGVARYNKPFTGDGALNLRTMHAGSGRDARIGQILWPDGSNVLAAAPRDGPGPHDSSACRSDTARQDVQQQHLQGASGRSGPELYISRNPVRGLAPYATLEDPPIRRGLQVSPS